MDAEPRARTPIPYGVAARRNTWLKSLAKPFLFLLVVLTVNGCASMRTPLTEEERDKRIRSWNLPTPNPWFQSETP